jgi:hypothetical protein
MVELAGFDARRCSGHIGLERDVFGDVVKITRVAGEVAAGKSRYREQQADHDLLPIWRLLRNFLYYDIATMMTVTWDIGSAHY